MALIPFDDRDGHIWFNGDYINWRDARLHILSHGLHYASSVFEGERVYGGSIFRSRAHTERLHRSAALMGFEIPYSVDEIEVAKHDMVERTGVGEGYVRPIAWRGSEMMGVSAQQTRINVAIALWDWPSYFDAEAKTKGINLAIARWRRPSPECAPTDSKAAGLYMICTLSKHEAEAQGLHDALMLDYRGLVAEATGANVFFVMEDGRLHTPIPDCFLDGITRRTVMALARQRRYEIVERQIRPEEMAGASECFLTGTAAEVTPVGSIGKYRFTPGRITAELDADYKALVRSTDTAVRAAE